MKVGDYVRCTATGRVVEVIKWLDDDIAGGDMYLVRDLLTGEESPLWDSQAAWPALNEMEVLAWMTR